MTIAIGERLPAATLSEYIEVPTEGCPIGPTSVQVQDAVKGKTIVLFGLPGAFTPTCSAQHVPGYVELAPQFKAKGVDEIWCVSVNDAFVMGAWGREQKTTGLVRMMGDGSASFTKALGLELDLTSRNMGIRSRRYSALVVDGVVKQLNLEEGAKFDVSNAETMLKQLG